MKKLLLLVVSLVIAGLLAVFVGVRIVGPKLISVSAPGGTPIGEFDSPRAETSLLAVHIAVPVSLLDELANSQAPERFQGSEVNKDNKTIRNGSYTWDVARGEIRFVNSGSELSFTVPFEGNAKISGEIDARLLTIPVDGTVEIGGTAGGTLVPEVLADWSIRPNLVPNLILDKASLSLGQLGKLEISDLLGSSLGGFLQRELQKLTPALRNGISLHREVTKLWEEAYLSELVSRDPPVWINVTPQKLLLGPVDYSITDQVSVTVCVQSKTFLTNREPLKPELAPLPDLHRLEAPAATDLQIPVILGMRELNEVLKTEAFRIDTGFGTKIDISELEAEVGQDGFLNLKLNIEAGKSHVGRKIAGEIWVKGRPVINYGEMTLGFSEVELTVETRDKLSGAAAWLLEGYLVKGIESQLRADLREHREEINEEVQNAIASADLPPGIDVSLRNLEVNLSDVYTVTRHFPGGEPDPGIVIVIRATGDMSTRINQLELKPRLDP